MSHVLFLLTGGLLNKVGGGGGAAGEQATMFNFLGLKIGSKRRITLISSAKGSHIFPTNGWKQAINNKRSKKLCD